MVGCGSGRYLLSEMVGEYTAIAAGAALVYATVSGAYAPERLSLSFGQRVGEDIGAQYMMVTLVMLAMELLVDVLCIKVETPVTP